MIQVNHQKRQPSVILTAALVAAAACAMVSLSARADAPKDATTASNRIQTSPAPVVTNRPFDVTDSTPAPAKSTVRQRVAEARQKYADANAPADPLPADAVLTALENGGESNGKRIKTVTANVNTAHAAVVTLIGAKGDPSSVNVPIGHSTLVKTKWRVKNVSTANPEIADVQVITPEQILIIGKKLGSTNVTLWSAEGETWQGLITVGIDLERLKQNLGKFLPGSKLTLTQSQEVVVISGQLRRADDSASLHRFMNATGVKYVDMTKTAGVQQVQIRVRVAEASRQAVRSLGVNAVHRGNDFFGGSTIGDNPNNIDIGVPAGASTESGLPFLFNSATSVNSAVTLFGGFPQIDLQLFLEALEDNQYIRVLAEPTLVALSGQEASFLAGGEFPVPIVQGSSAGAGTTITVEYKEFGVRLNFTPTVMGDGKIRLFVAPEVSDLSDVGAVTVEGFRIPSLLTRRASTTLEMRSGQTFAMAGLIDRSVTARSEAVPGIGEVPILGSLFRSVRYEKGDTELLVLATVSLVEPINDPTDPMVPGEAHITPSDWELYAGGKISGKAKMPDNGSNVWLKERGLDRLKGPGAWANYERRRNAPRKLN